MGTRGARSSGAVAGGENVDDHFTRWRDCNHSPSSHRWPWTTTLPLPALLPLRKLFYVDITTLPSATHSRYRHLCQERREANRWATLFTLELYCRPAGWAEVLKRNPSSKSLSLFGSFYCGVNLIPGRRTEPRRDRSSAREKERERERERRKIE